VAFSGTSRHPRVAFRLVEALIRLNPLLGAMAPKRVIYERA
jgi:hypothetical protein